MGREDLSANKIKISQHNDLSKRHEIEDFVAETVEMKCADSKHDIKHQEKGAIDGVINIDDTNASENEQSIKITEEKRGLRRSVRKLTMQKILNPRSILRTILRK